MRMRVGSVALQLSSSVCLWGLEALAFERSKVAVTGRAPSDKTTPAEGSDGTNSSVHVAGGGEGGAGERELPVEGVCV